MQWLSGRTTARACQCRPRPGPGMVQAGPGVPSLVNGRRRSTQAGTARRPWFSGLPAVLLAAGRRLEPSGGRAAPADGAGTVTVTAAIKECSDRLRGPRGSSRATDCASRGRQGCQGHLLPNPTSTSLFTLTPVMRQKIGGAGVRRRKGGKKEAQRGWGVRGGGDTCGIRRQRDS